VHGLLPCEREVPLTTVLWCALRQSHIDYKYPVSGREARWIMSALEATYRPYRLSHTNLPQVVQEEEELWGLIGQCKELLQTEGAGGIVLT
jgi:hypothetical protein